MQDQKKENLIRAFLLLRDREDCRRFLDDLLTGKETEELSSRLEVARLLREGENYNDIAAATGASTATISRVSKCISGEAGGYRKVLALLETEPLPAPSDFLTRVRASGYRKLTLPPDADLSLCLLAEKVSARPQILAEVLYRDGRRTARTGNVMLRALSACRNDGAEKTGKVYFEEADGHRTVFGLLASEGTQEQNAADILALFPSDGRGTVSLKDGVLADAWLSSYGIPSLYRDRLQSAAVRGEDVTPLFEDLALPAYRARAAREFLTLSLPFDEALRMFRAQIATPEMEHALTRLETFAACCKNTAAMRYVSALDTDLFSGLSFSFEGDGGKTRGGSLSSLCPGTFGALSTQ